MMKSQLRWVSLAALLAAGLSLPGTPALGKAPATGSVYVIQALPDAAISVAVDGKQQTADAAVKTILGPYDLSPGKHTLTLTSNEPSWTMKSVVTVEAGKSKDVVLHRPASASGDPVITVYPNPMAPVNADEGRVMVAHTAVVPPADITVNGEVFFANIANGEFLTADVPGGTYEVAIVPTGTSDDPVLGPLDLEVESSTLTQVFAIGQPQGGGMDVIVHKLPLQKAGSGAPTVINTGSAGLVDDWEVSGAKDTGVQPATLLWLAGAALILSVGASPMVKQLSRRARDRRIGGA
ncbi:MAG: DUF4397 domain-containing protein [Nocardioidaceae bacterium]|nr:DUF4397 domain-containing protein [Nocardioidaceae bacterium]